MLQLPIVQRDPEETNDLCKCRPVCKSRRRKWKGKVQNSSAELLIERKPLPECFRRWPKEVFPNGPCPLLGRSRRVTVTERGAIRGPQVARICHAPVDDSVDLTYLRLADITKQIGAWHMVRSRCAFCSCAACCSCEMRDYEPHDAERSLRRASDMRAFDARVKADSLNMRMYDKP